MIFISHNHGLIRQVTCHAAHYKIEVLCRIALFYGKSFELSFMARHELKSRFWFLKVLRQEFNHAVVGFAIHRRRVHLHQKTAVGLNLDRFMFGVWFNFDCDLHVNFTTSFEFTSWFTFELNVQYIIVAISSQFIWHKP